MLAQRQPQAETRAPPPISSPANMPENSPQTTGVIPLHHRQAGDPEAPLRMAGWGGEPRWPQQKEPSFHEGSWQGGQGEAEGLAGAGEQGGSVCAPSTPARSLRDRLCVWPPHGAPPAPVRAGLTERQTTAEPEGKDISGP